MEQSSIVDECSTKDSPAVVIGCIVSDVAIGQRSKVGLGMNTAARALGDILTNK